MECKYTHKKKPITLKTRIDKIIPKLTAACFAIRAVRSFLPQETLKMIYYSYFRSIMMYGIIFWGNQSLKKNY